MKLPEVVAYKTTACGPTDAPLWRFAIVPDSFARAFAPLPDLPIWQWADENVWLESKEAAESGPYRSAKTPWARRLQDLIRQAEMWCFDSSEKRWVKVQVREYNGMKSSQSGFSEACLNGIRWKAQFRPCNVIYTVDTRETARDISERLKPSLEKLDGDIFTGDDDDVGTFVMRLRAMDIWFQGSFSMGKFVGKMAPLVISDEGEEHGEDTKDTSTNTALKSRKKTADNGLQINICKAKRKKGPIHRGFIRGNQEEFMIACPHCHKRQPLTFFRNEDDKRSPQMTMFTDDLAEVRDEVTGEVVAVLPTPLQLGQERKLVTGRIVFEHCKDELGRWDKLRILRDTYYECGHCKGRIDEHSKRDLAAEAEWIPTAIGTPGVVSQHINDLYSTDANSSWGQIVLEYLDAKREGRRELQGFFNHRLGLPWSDEAQKTDHSDIKANIAGRDEGDLCPAFKRGTVPLLTYPEKGAAIIVIGSDIGLAYARWAAGVVAPNLQDIAIFDWGEELDPEGVGEVMMRTSWTLVSDSAKKLRARYCFVDARYRKTDVYRVCLAVPGHVMIPCTGIGGTAARAMRLFSWNQIPAYPKGLKQLGYNDREAKDELYIDRIKNKKRRVWFPVDVVDDSRFMDELSAEELIEDDKGVTKWSEDIPDNHDGDCVKNIVTGVRFLTRKQQME